MALEDIAAKAAFDSSPLLGRACVWTSVTPYLKNRFDKRRPIGFDALIDSYRSQIALEWRRRFSAETIADSFPTDGFHTVSAFRGTA